MGRRVPQVARGRCAAREVLEVAHDDVDAVFQRHAPEVAPEFVQQPVVENDVEYLLLEQVEAALAHGAGPLLESVRLFDVYAGEQVDAGRKSLAFALRFRAPDRTLTVEEVSAARDSAVAAASAAVGAVQRA